MAKLEPAELEKYLELKRKKSEVGYASVKSGKTQVVPPWKLLQEFEEQMGVKYGYDWKTSAINSFTGEVTQLQEKIE